MTKNTEKWLYGLGSAAISGGSASVVSGAVSMGIDPEKFNISSTSGMGHMLELGFANFMISGLLGAFFYLKQSPLPPASFDTAQITRMIASADAQLQRPTPISQATTPVDNTTKN